MDASFERLNQAGIEKIIMNISLKNQYFDVNNKFEQQQKNIISNNYNTLRTLIIKNFVYSKNRHIDRNQ